MKRRKTPGFWLALIAATALVFSVSIGAMHVRYAQERRALAEQRLYRDQLKLYVSDLNDELKYVQSDEFVIRTARDELGLLMPNEVRYVNSAR